MLLICHITVTLHVTAKFLDRTRIGSFITVGSCAHIPDGVHIISCGSLPTHVDVGLYIL